MKRLMTLLLAVALFSLTSLTLSMKLGERS